MEMIFCNTVMAGERKVRMGHLFIINIYYNYE